MSKKLLPASAITAKRQKIEKEIEVSCLPPFTITIEGVVFKKNEEVMVHNIKDPEGERSSKMTIIQISDNRELFLKNEIYQRYKINLQQIARKKVRIEKINS